MKENYRIETIMVDYHSSRNASFRNLPLLYKSRAYEHRLYSTCESIKDALNELEGLARRDGADYIDDEQISYIVKDINRTNGDDSYTVGMWKKDNPWFVGEGYYNRGECVYKRGWLCYESDIWTYKIEEINDINDENFK